MHDVIDLGGEAIELGGLKAKRRVGDVPDNHLQMLAGERWKRCSSAGSLPRTSTQAGGALPGSAARTMQISLPSTLASRSSHSRHRKRPRKPVAPVISTVHDTSGGGAGGTFASVWASMNFVTSRSMALIWPASFPWTLAKVGCALAPC